MDRDRWVRLLSDHLKEAVDTEASTASVSLSLDQLLQRASAHNFERDGVPAPIPPSPRMVFGRFDYQPMVYRYRCKRCGHTYHQTAGSLLWLYGVPEQCVPVTE